MTRVTENGPLLPHIGVLSLVDSAWATPWRSRHQILTRLARYFNVAWAEPAPHWRDGVARIRTGRPPETPIPERPGFSIYTPEPWLPSIYRPQWLARSLFRARLKRARQHLLRRGCTRIVLYIWRPEYSEALRLVPFDLSVYHIVDEYSFSDVDLPLDSREARLIASADQVFIHSPGLWSKKGTINPSTVFVPNGVDYALHSATGSEPDDLAGIPHPRVGYTGIIKRTLDWPLLLALTARHPDWNFVFVGWQNPAHEDMRGAIAEMTGRSNVRFLGSKTVTELATYAQHFDVCIMPYRADSHSMKYGYPLKLHEYLATGRPTVGTPLRSLTDFSDVVALPSSVDEWSAALSAAMLPAANATGARAARQAVARAHDWDFLGARVAATLIERLGEVVPEPLARAHESGDDRAVRLRPAEAGDRTVRP